MRQLVFMKGNLGALLCAPGDGHFYEECAKKLHSYPVLRDRVLQNVL